MQTRGHELPVLRTAGFCICLQQLRVFLLHGYENVLSIGCAHMPPNIDLLEPADTANQVSAMSALGAGSADWSPLILQAR